MNAVKRELRTSMVVNPAPILLRSPNNGVTQCSMDSQRQQWCVCVWVTMSTWHILAAELELLDDVANLFESMDIAMCTAIGV
jgi:hypothetical protein